MLGSSDSNLSDPASSPSHSSSELSNTAHSSDDGLLQTLSPASFSPITDSASSPSPPPSRPRPVLQRRHRDIFNVIWSGSLRGFGSISLEELFAALGLWTREDENLCNFLLKHREFFDIFKRVLVSRDPSELCTHPLLHNPLNLIIEETLTKYDSAFHPIRQGIFPSASFDTRSGLGANAWGHLRDLDGPGCVQDIQHMDSIFSSKKDYITASMTTKSRKLAQGLLHQWGFHFSYSAIRNSDPRESPLISQNLELALTLFKASIASVEPKDRSALADRYFQSLILARTVVLYQFLDSLPCNLSPDEARKEWLYFQFCPPRTSSDTHTFGSVFHALASGSREDLRSCAKGWMFSTIWMHFRWFPQSFALLNYSGTLVPCMNEGVQPPFHIVVHEAVTPTNNSDRLHSRRAMRYRRAVCELFWCESSS